MTASIPVRAARSALVGTARALLSLRAIDLPPPGAVPRILVANHVSHADFVALWSVLPPAQRLRTRPVAGSTTSRHASAAMSAATRQGSS